MARSRKLGSRITTWLGLRLGWLLLLFLRLLVRVRVANGEVFEELKRNSRPILIAVWHGRILLPILVHRNQGIIPMISQSRDGELITRAVEKLGYRAIRGSSSRRSKEAMQEMIAALAQPSAVAAIMPDGPTGPRHKAKPGVIRIAREAGAVILPMSFACRRPKIFRSWDRFQLWKPFSRAVVLYGEPIHLDPEANPEADRLRVEAALIAVEERCDNWFTRESA